MIKVIIVDDDELCISVIEDMVNQLDEFSCIGTFLNALDAYNFINSNKDKHFLIARSGNVLGGGDMSKDRIVPDIMRSLIKKTKLIIRSPSAVRPWQHVLEPLHGYLILGNYLMTNKLNNKIVPNWNFGPNINNIKSVKEIANKSLKLWNIKKRILFRNDKKFKEVNFLMLNSNKAKKEIFWKPKLNFNDTMKLTVDWYKSFHKNERKF